MLPESVSTVPIEVQLPFAEMDKMVLKLSLTARDPEEPHINRNSKRVRDVNVGAKTVTLLEEASMTLD